MDDSTGKRISQATDSHALLKIASARRGPYFYVVDENLDVLVRRMRSNVGPQSGALPPDVATAAKALIDRGFATATEDSAVVTVRRGLVLRMIRLEGGTRARYALFLEPFEQRDLLRVAAMTYGLTNREREVLELMLRGESTSAISRRLHIADATVQHHVKNIGSKVGVSKRVEIVAAVVGALR